MSTRPLGGGRIAWCAAPDPQIGQILTARLPGAPNLGDISLNAVQDNLIGGSA